jgi:hypothetical protein
MKDPYPILKFSYNKNTYYDNSWHQNFFYEDYFGNVISKNKYKFAKSFNDGYAFVYDYNQKWNIINPLGNSVLEKFPRPTSRIVEKAFKYITPKDGFFLKNYVVRDNIILSVDVEELKKEFKIFDVKRLPNENKKHGYLIINKYNAQKMSLIEDYSISGNGLIAIKHFDKQWIYISIESFNKHLLDNKHFDETFEYASGFNEGLAKVKKGGYFGFIDTTGKFSIPAIYDDARSFSKGFAAVAIANCRNFEGWNNGKKIYDLAWNFIDKNNKTLLNESKYNLTSLDEENNYYFESTDKIGYTFFWENLDKNYFREMSLEGVYGWEDKSFSPIMRDFWYNSNILGQFSPGYLVDLLTAQNSNELGFHKWWVASWISKDRNCSSQNLGSSFSKEISKRENIIAETVYIDFDTTQTQFDYIQGINSLENKYGLDYTEINWKTKTTYPPSSNYSPNLDIDWSNYNDNLDMDQQDIDFWNQF